MGRDSRRRAQRRAGEVPLTRKEEQRYAVKANRRARRVQPTVDDLTRVAAQGDIRLTEALIARSTIRMDNQGAMPPEYSMQVLESITSLLALDKALVRLGVSLRRRPGNYVGTAARHLAWGVDSVVAACRLLLVGQIAGAAVIARQQLEHWTMFLSKARGMERGDSSIQQFISRCWDPFIDGMDAATEGDLAGLTDAMADKFPFEGTEPVRLEATEGHRCVEFGDGVSVCPAVLYGDLSELLHADSGQSAIAWEAVECLTPGGCTAEVVNTAAAVVHALQLSLIQIHFIVAALVKDRDSGLAALVLATMPGYGARNGSPVEWDDVDPLPTLAESVPPDGLVSPDLASLMPLTVEEGLQSSVVSHVANRAELYEAVVAGRRPEDRLYRNDELASLAFDSHRYSSVVTALDALNAERRYYGANFDPHRLTGRGAGYVVVAEIAALLSRWEHGRPQSAASAALVSSTLRSAYWLWLEDDDRAMATLRCTLEQTARLRVCHIKPEKAEQLTARSSTMPKDWLEAAGWRRLAALNRALSEFAHAHEESRWSGARRLLAMLQIDPDEDALFTARGAAVDFATKLVARESIRVITDEHSSDLATALTTMLAGWNIDVDLDDSSLNPVLDHIWSHRQTTLGPVPLRWS